MREVCMSTGWWSEILYWLAFRRIASVGVFPTATAKSVMQSPRSSWQIGSKVSCTKSECGLLFQSKDGYFYLFTFDTRWKPLVLKLFVTPPPPNIIADHYIPLLLVLWHSFSTVTVRHYSGDNAWRLARHWRLLINKYLLYIRELLNNTSKNIAATLLSKLILIY